MTEGYRNRRPLLLAALLAAVAAGGCGGTAPVPTPKEGRSAFSYDDDEIDPRSLKPGKGRPRPAGKR